jgi:hypothetical protein
MKRKIRHVTAALLLMSLVLALAGGVLAQGNGTHRPTVRFEGIVNSRPVDTKSGTWEISGQVVVVVESTRIIENRGAAEEGAKVVVLANRLDTGELEAIQIRVVEPAVATVKIRGFVTELGLDSLVVNGLTIEYTAETVIEGELELGAFVKIEAQVLPTGYVATAIEVMPVARPRVVEFEGTIETMEDANETVEGNQWIIAEREVTVTDSTVIIGTPDEGKHAEVRALVQSDGELLALRIKVIEEPELVEWTGTIERLPPRRQGFWVVGDRTVLVTPRTDIDGVPELGETAHVKALQYRGRPLFAVQIEIVEPTPTETPVPGETPEPAATH